MHHTYKFLFSYKCFEVYMDNNFYLPNIITKSIYYLNNS